MISYSWKKILKSSKHSSKNVLAILSYITFSQNRVPFSYVNIYSGRDFKGDSFLLNPERIFIHRNDYTDKDLVNYVGLASLRSFSEYQVHGTKTLEYDFLTSKQQRLVDRNPLLTTSDGLIHFKFETEE